MKSLAVSITLVLIAGSGNALAGCSSTQIQGTALTTLLNNKLVCGRPIAGNYPGPTTDRWQEEHIPGSPLGTLIDFKLGPGHPIDPRKPVGNWQVKDVGAATRVYHIYSGSQFAWSVHDNGDTTYSFCTQPDPGGSEVVVAYIVPINPTLGCNDTYPP